MKIRLLLLLCASLAPAQVPQAFLAAPSTGLRRPADADKRLRAVTIVPGLFDQDSAKPEKLVDFNLFDDLLLRVKLEKMEHAGPGDKTVIWTGTVLNTKRGSVVMAVTGKVHSATITTDTATFALQHATEGKHWISERDFSQVTPEAEPLRVPSGELPLRRAPAIEADDGSIVDVLVVYTPAARAAAGGTTQMNNLIALGIAETNQGYANSGVIQRARLVHAQEVAYTESGSFSTDLTRLRSSTDGFIDQIHALRDTHRADIVSLWVNSGDACGIGYLLTDTNTDFSSRAFNVVRRDCATGHYTLAHEMGHNMGATHDLANSGGPGLFSYSYGFQQKTVQPFFRTIMAYACSGGVVCGRINFWSNPDVSYSGLATGIGSTDNRLTLNNSRTISANWRQASATLTISPTSATFGSAPASGSITVTASVAWAATSNANWITITSGASGSGNGTVNYNVLANPTSSTRVGSITVGGSALTVTQSGASVSCSSTAITLPATFNSSLIAGDCSSPLRAGSLAKRYTFNASAGQQIAIQMTSAVIDSYLYLLGPTGNVLASDDDSGEGVSSRIPAAGFYTLPTTGIYTIETTSFNDNETGVFTLAITTPANCSFTISPTSRSVDFNINTGTVSITTASGCSWSASPNATWISVSSQGTGTGSGSTTYSVQANPSGTSRSGTITIAGQTFTITQSGLPSGCTVTPIASGQTVNANLTAGNCSSQSRGANYYAGRYSFNGTVGQQVSIVLTSPTLDTYLYLIGPNGNVVASDDDSAGNLNSRIPSSGQLTLQQNGTYVIEATTFDSLETGSYSLTLLGGCSFSVSPLTASYGSGAATGSVAVTTASGCAWTAASNSAFLAITSGSSGSGSGTTTYSLSSNPTGGSRLGTLTIAGIAVTINQSGQASSCSATSVSFPRVVTGNLLSSACFSTGRGSGYYADRYTFGGTSGQQVAITLDSGAFDTYLYLISPTGTVLISDDDGGLGTGSRIPANTGMYTLPFTGTYTIEATTYSTNRTGSYTLTLTGSATQPGSGPYRFVAVTPCRVADTRTGSGFTGAFGPPVMAGGTSRSMQVTASTCGIPAGARAFSLNITVVPRGPLSYLTTWPSDQPQPFVSTLNSPLGRIVANAAIVPSSSTGAVSVFVSDTSDVIIDINGYFTP